MADEPISLFKHYYPEPDVEENYKGYYTDRILFDRTMRSPAIMAAAEALRQDTLAFAKESLNRSYTAARFGIPDEEMDDHIFSILWSITTQEEFGQQEMSHEDFFNRKQEQFKSFDELAKPQPNAAIEASARVGRGAAVGTSEVEAGFNGVIASLLRGERNEYIDKTTAEAQADLPMLERRIAVAKAEIQDRLKRQPRGFAPPTDTDMAKLPELERQLGHARLAAQGKVEESFLGSWSRASDEVAAGHRETAEERKGYLSDYIVPAHDGWWVMRVADSVGQSVPGMAASMLNPAFGLSLMYAQTFENSLTEYQESMTAQGKVFTPEEAERYAHEQALFQTPWELVGDVAVGKMVKNIFKTIPTGKLTGGPETFGQWLGDEFKEIVKAMPGEVLVTTPAQTIGEAVIAENAGVRAPTTAGEKAAQTIDAMSVALGQVSGMGAGSTLTAGTVKAGKGDFGVVKYDAAELVKLLEENPSDPRSRALSKWFHGGWEDLQTGREAELAKALTSILRGMPVFKADGPIYRAVRFKSEERRVAFLKKFRGEWWENDKPFMSASKDLEVARQQSKYSPFPVVLEIEKNLSGKDMGWFDSMNPSYRWQREILFLRGATFNILGMRTIDADGKKVYIIRLSETL